MNDLITEFARQPISLCVSFAALVLSAASFLYSIRTGRFSRRLTAHEKKTETLGTLTEARFTISQILLRLRSRRPQIATRWPEALPGLDEQIAEAEKVEKNLDAEFTATLAAPANVLSMERRRQAAAIELASAKSVVLGLELVEQRLGSRGPTGGAA